MPGLEHVIDLLKVRLTPMLPIPNAAQRKRTDSFSSPYDGLDLDEEEKRLYFNATPETLLYEISAKEKIHGEKSKSRHLISSIQPFVDSIDHFGKALDVFANSYPLVMRYVQFRAQLTFVSQILHLVRYNFLIGSTYTSGKLDLDYRLGTLVK